MTHEVATIMSIEQMWGYQKPLLDYLRTTIDRPIKQDEIGSFLSQQNDINYELLHKSLTALQDQGYIYRVGGKVSKSRRYKLTPIARINILELEQKGSLAKVEIPIEEQVGQDVVKVLVQFPTIEAVQTLRDKVGITQIDDIHQLVGTARTNQYYINGLKNRASRRVETIRHLRDEGYSSLMKILYAAQILGFNPEEEKLLALGGRIRSVI